MKLNYRNDIVTKPDRESQLAANIAPCGN